MFVQRQRNEQDGEQQSDDGFKHGGYLLNNVIVTQKRQPITGWRFFCAKREAIKGKIDAIRGLTISLCHDIIMSSDSDIEEGIQK